MKIESFLPVFNGFYGTFFECNCEEAMIEDGKTYEDYNWDYKDYNQRIAEACVSEIQNELKDFNINIEIQTIKSPRFYNYSNDSINVEYTLTKKSFNQLIKYCKDNLSEFEAYLEDHYKSRSGFVSFYEYDSQTWLNEYLKDEKKLEHCFGAILEFYFENEGYTDSDLADAVSYENWIDCELLETV